MARDSSAKSYTAAPPPGGKGIGLLAALLALGCAVDAGEPSAETSRAGGEPGRDDGPSAGVAGATSSCSDPHAVVPKRVVRLTEHQLFNAYVSLFGAAAAATLTQNEPAPSLFDRELPPIGSDVGVGDALVGKRRAVPLPRPSAALGRPPRVHGRQRHSGVRGGSSGHRRRDLGDHAAELHCAVKRHVALR